MRKFFRGHNFPRIPEKGQTMSNSVDPDETPGPALFGRQASYSYTTLKDSKQSKKLTLKAPIAIKKYF